MWWLGTVDFEQFSGVVPANIFRFSAQIRLGEPMRAARASTAIVCASMARERVGLFGKGAEDSARAHQRGSYGFLCLVKPPQWLLCWKSSVDNA